MGQHSGFRAYTVNKKIGFNPFYSKTVPTYGLRLFNKGLHGAVEAWMIENPGKRIPGTEFTKKFGCSRSTVVHIARLIEKAHNLPKRKFGAPATALPKPVIDIIEKSYATAHENSVINVWNVLREIAKETGIVYSPSTIFSRLINLGKKHKKGVKTTMRNGPIESNASVMEVALAFAKEGIIVKGFRGRKRSRLKTHNS